jgi:hypothetical protein
MVWGLLGWYNKAMALTKLPEPDAESLEMAEQARATVEQEITEFKTKGISIYYRECPGGPLIQELPDGTKHLVAPPARDG